MHTRHSVAPRFGNTCITVFAMRQARALMQLAARPLDRLVHRGIDLVLHRPITRPSGRHVCITLLVCF